MSKKVDNFKRISIKRKLEIITLISKLTNFKNKQFYEYHKDDIEAMFKDIQEALDVSKKQLLDEYKILK